jgi:hypothetical protein
VTLPKRSVADFIPHCLYFEKQSWLNEMTPTGQLSPFFDGTCHHAEMMNLVVRFISKDNKICHRLAVRILKKSLNGNALFAWILEVMTGQYQIPASYSILLA